MTLFLIITLISSCIIISRRTTSQTSDSGDEKESQPLIKQGTNNSDDTISRHKSKKSLFRSKITKVSTLYFFCNHGICELF